jgi:hypothetical protein
MLPCSSRRVLLVNAENTVLVWESKVRLLPDTLVDAMLQKSAPFVIRDRTHASSAKVRPQFSGRNYRRKKVIKGAPYHEPSGPLSIEGIELLGDPARVRRGVRQEFGGHIEDK